MNEKFRAYNSSPEQEAYLATGGSLADWYGGISRTPKLPASLTSGKELEAEARACAYRMCAELMLELDTPLKRRETLSLCKAATIIAREPREAERDRLEKYTVDQAFERIVNGG